VARTADRGKKIRIGDDPKTSDPLGRYGRRWCVILFNSMIKMRGLI
jgi:hypothetical protein